MSCDCPQVQACILVKTESGCKCIANPEFKEENVVKTMSCWNCDKSFEKKIEYDDRRAFCPVHGEKRLDYQPKVSKLHWRRLRN